MNQFTEWLEKEVCGKQIFYYILGVTILNFILVFSNLFLLIEFKANLSGLSQNSVSSEQITPALFIPMIFAAAEEEAIFRLLPLCVAKACKLSTNQILIIALLSSILFGYVHGIMYNILLQGVSGFLFCLLFLKCGGLQSHYWKACFVSSTAHYLNNAILLTITLLVQ